MTSNTPFILIADDLGYVIEMWQQQLERYGVKVVAATSMHELFERFTMFEQKLDGIILDGCIPGHQLNTDLFISYARCGGFAAPILAASSDDLYRDIMVMIGCSHQAPKEEAVELMVDILTAP